MEPNIYIGEKYKITISNFKLDWLHWLIRYPTMQTPLQYPPICPILQTFEEIMQYQNWFDLGRIDGGRY